MGEDVPVVFDTRIIREITERSDVDPHQSMQSIRRQLADEAEDWGDGFFVDPEPVVVKRDSQGGIVRTIPLSELAWEPVDEDKYPPVEVDPIPSPRLLSGDERDLLVSILAKRLLKWYQAQKPQLGVFNPWYDGIPVVPKGSPQAIQPLPGTKMYPATYDQILSWLKTDVIGPRAAIVNKQFGRDRYRPDAASNFALRLSRDPL